MQKINLNQLAVTVECSLGLLASGTASAATGALFTGFNAEKDSNLPSSPNGEILLVNNTGAYLINNSNSYLTKTQ